MDGLKLDLVACFKENYKRTKFRTEAYITEEGDAFEVLRSTYHAQIETFATRALSLALSLREAWASGVHPNPFGLFRTTSMYYRVGGCARINRPARVTLPLALQVARPGGIRCVLRLAEPGGLREAVGQRATAERIP